MAQFLDLVQQLSTHKQELKEKRLYNIITKEHFLTILILLEVEVSSLMHLETKQAKAQTETFRI